MKYWFAGLVLIYDSGIVGIIVRYDIKPGYEITTAMAKSTQMNLGYKLVM